MRKEIFKKKYWQNDLGGGRIKMLGEKIRKRRTKENGGMNES